VANFIAEHNGKLTESGHKRFVRNGYLPEREIQTGIGGLAVKQPRVRDRGDKDDFYILLDAYSKVAFFDLLTIYL